MMKKPIYVSRPSLPPLEKVSEMLRKVWDSHILSNMGEYEVNFAGTLKEKFNTPNLTLMTNGTTALSICLRALDLTGEIITTPFTFAATSSAIVWNHCRPVFCDIDEKTMNIDPEKIENLITPLTTAILAVHVYGTPCDNDRLSAIARKHNLKLIYDAAHAFDVKKDGEYIVKWGDASVLSFHATKKFHSFEGGAIITSNPLDSEKIAKLRNFGFEDSEHIAIAGVNGKMDEFRSIIGLLQLENIEYENKRRMEAVSFYRDHLSGIEGIKLLPSLPGVENNNGYFPIFVQSEYPLTRDELSEKLCQKEIICRKYFYPLVSNFEAFRHLPSAQPYLLPVANRAAQSVLCLPLHSFLTKKNLKEITATIQNI